MDARIRLKLGDLEVEYEGSESFIKSNLLALVSEAIELLQERGDQIPKAQVSPPLKDSDKQFSGTTSTIASKLSAKSGPDLIIAATTRLTLVLGLESFSRQQLLDEMKSASAYYKKSYSNNLSSYLQRLVKSNDLIEAATDTYALSASKRTEVEKTIV